MLSKYFPARDSWLDANQSPDRAKEKHKIRIEAIVLLDSDWLLSANNMETVPSGQWQWKWGESSFHLEHIW